MKEEERCQCQRTSPGMRCLLKATADDMLCDKCRQRCRKPQIFRTVGRKKGNDGEGQGG